jgi:hypothetical protein
MKFTIAILFLSFSSQLCAQSLDSILLVKYSKDETTNMEKTNPDSLEFIRYSSLNGYYFVDLPEKKNFNSRISGDVVIDNLESFNFLELNIEFLDDNYKYYTVRDKKVLLVVKSIDHIKAELKSNND